MLRNQVLPVLLGGLGVLLLGGGVLLGGLPVALGVLVLILEVADRERPDISLMDLSLPVMDGMAATEKIRSSDGLRGIPIVAVTAHQETDFRAGAKAAGFDAYVTKPIDMDFLSELIKGLLA